MTWDGGDESRITALITERDRLRAALREARSWCISGANADHPRNVLAQVVATVDRALAAAGEGEDRCPVCDGRKTTYSSSHGRQPCHRCGGSGSRLPEPEGNRS